MEHHAHKIKCLNCSLHFTVHSYDEDWKPTGGCPECGKPLTRVVHWHETVEGDIYEHVPGIANRVGVKL